MKKTLLLTLIAIATATLCRAQDYDAYFTPERLRLDLVFAGDASGQEVFIGGLHAESAWDGPRKRLVDDFGYGDYRVTVESGGKTIYSRGFCSLFSEWRTTAEAKVTRKAFNNSVWIPMPKEKVTVGVDGRLYKTGEFSRIGTFDIDPADYQINRDRENDYALDTLMLNGPCETKVDIVLAAEGYTAAEMGKFRTDAVKFMNYLFDYEPYKSHRNDFNFFAVESVSNESGTDVPNEDKWKNTAFGSGFCTFGTDRYLTAQDQKQLAQAVSGATFDLPVIIVNYKRYGGGGIYNFYSLCTSDDKYEAYVFVHEFSHAFAGLADEYYTSDVAYEDRYNLKTEPWEPNITTKVDFASKWKDLPGTGLYEGGGYMAKGVFRSAEDCIMLSRTAPFCPACSKAIVEMIGYYSEKTL